MKNILITLTTMTLLLAQTSAHAGIKCWTNKDGVKECGTVVPPEYSQKRIETRSTSGRVVEVEERAKNDEEIAEMQRQEEIRKQQEKIAEEQKRKDMVLLNTFTTERDINLQRDSKIAVIDGFIKVTEGNNKMLSTKLNKLQKTAADNERQGKQPAEALVHEIESIERQIKNNEDTVTNKRAEQESIRQEFGGYLSRFRELKGIKPKPEAKPEAANAEPEKTEAATTSTEPAKTAESKK